VNHYYANEFTLIAGNRPLPQASGPPMPGDSPCKGDRMRYAHLDWHPAIAKESFYEACLWTGVIYLNDLFIYQQAESKDVATSE
jgi:hypothetical protein